MTTSRTGQVLPIPHPGRNWSARNITPSTIRMMGPVRPCRVRLGSVHGPFIGCFPRLLFALKTVRACVVTGFLFL